MSRTGWIVTVVVIVALVVVAWALGWFRSMSSANPSGSSAAAVNAVTPSNSAAAAQSIDALSTAIAAVNADVAAYTKTPSQATLAAGVTHVQTALAAMGNAEIVLKARVAAKAPAAATSPVSFTDFDQAQSAARSQVLTLQAVLGTNAKLDVLALRNAGSQLKAALAALQRGLADAQAIQKVFP